MTRVFPVERRVVKALKPVLTRAAGVPMPEDTVFDAVERLHRELDEVRDLLVGSALVGAAGAHPENVVLAEARRSYTTLSLFGYRVDGVVANRVFPARRRRHLAGRLGGRAGRGARARSSESFAGLPVWRSEYRRRRAGRGRGADRRSRRELYADADPLAVPAGRRARSGSTRSRPADRCCGSRCRSSPATEVDLARNGDELVVTVASYRRLLTLPTGLARHRIAGARVDAGRAAGEVRGEDAVNDEARPRTRPRGGLARRGGGQAARRAVLLGPDQGTDLGDRRRRAGRPRGRRACARSTSTSPPGPPSAPTARSAGSSTPSARPRRRCARTCASPPPPCCRRRPGCSPPRSPTRTARPRPAGRASSTSTSTEPGPRTARRGPTEARSPRDGPGAVR